MEEAFDNELAVITNNSIIMLTKNLTILPETQVITLMIRANVASKVILGNHNSDTAKLVHLAYRHLTLSSLKQSWFWLCSIAHIKWYSCAHGLAVTRNSKRFGYSCVVRF